MKREDEKLYSKEDIVGFGGKLFIKEYFFKVCHIVWSIRR